MAGRILRVVSHWDFGEDVIHPLIGPVKPIEFGVSGLIGETRVTKNLVGPRVSTTWAVVADAKILNGAMGNSGRVFCGRGLGFLRWWN